MSSELSLVIPALNEENRLRPTLESYLSALEARRSPFEIIIVADGCSDKTVEVANSFAERSVSVLEYQERRGKGGAVLDGIKAARHSIVGFVDADGSILPSELLKLVDALDRFDGAIASRWLDGSNARFQQPPERVIASRTWNLLVRTMLSLPYKDTQCGGKVFKRDAIMPVLNAVALTNWAFDVSLLYHLSKSGCKVKEIPINWVQSYGSRMRLPKEIPVMFFSLIGIRIMSSPAKSMVPRRGVEWFLQKWGRT